MDEARLSGLADPASMPSSKSNHAIHIDEPTILTPKAISSVVLISSMFCLTYLWFRRGIFSVWDSLTFDPSIIVSGALPTPGQNLGEEEQVQFAFIAAATHTFVLILGMFLWIGTYSIFHSPRVQKFLPAFRQRAAIELGVVVLLSYGFFVVLFGWFTSAFNSRQGRPYRWARAFFYEEGELPFASCASISYSLCLIFGYLIKLSTNGSRFSAFPPCYRRYAWKGLATFVASYLFVRYIAIGAFRRFGRPLLLENADTSPQEFNSGFVALATGTHTVALVLGMAFALITRRGYKVFNSAICIAAIPSSTRALVHFFAFFIWVSFLVAAGVSGVNGVTSWLGRHSHEVPVHLVSASHLVWFSWGALFLTGSIPPLFRVLVDATLLPYKISPHASWFRRLWRLSIVAACYNLEKVSVVLLATSLIFAPRFPNVIAATWAAIILQYMGTYYNSPALTGRRRLPAFQKHWIFQELADYFQLSIRSRAQDLDPAHRYIFGFHPHGVLPLTIGFVQNTDLWRKTFPGIIPAPVTSSILHHVPLMRDFLQFSAGGDVSKQGIAMTLHRESSLVMVPGGQQEMINTSSTSNVIHICGRHKGFVKLAFQLAAASEEPIHLVPMFNFGENRILDNIATPTSWQQASVKYLRANVLFCPWGRWHIPGIPRREAMSLAIGRAICVPKVQRPTQADINALHGRYMHELHSVFDEEKHSVPFYQHTEMEIDGNVTQLPPDAWEDYVRGLVQAPHDEGKSLASLFGTRPGDGVEMLWTGVFWVMLFAVVYYRAFFLSEDSIVQWLL